MENQYADIVVILHRTSHPISIYSLFYMIQLYFIIRFHTLTKYSIDIQLYNVNIEKLQNVSDGL